METIGAVEIFHSSVKKQGLVYNQYLGDVDTSSYNYMVKNNPNKKYCDINPEKLEFIGPETPREKTKKSLKGHKRTSTFYQGRENAQKIILIQLKFLFFCYFIIIKNFMRISNLKKIIYFLINSCLVFIILYLSKKYVHSNA